MRKRYFFVFLLIISFTACSFQRSVSSPIPKNKALIFIPGFKGSYLVKKNSKQTVWVSAYQALFGNATLKYPDSDLTSAGVLRKVSIIPALYSIDIYNNFLSFLEKNMPPEYNLFTFSYDWREDNFENVKKLDLFIKELNANGFSDISIIAHSMGGLISSYFLRYGTQEPRTAIENWAGAKKINKVIVIGTPYKGSMLMFHDLMSGVKTLNNTSLLSAESLQSFPSSFQLLPNYSTQVINQNELLSEKIDFFDYNFWLENGFLKYIHPQKFVQQLTNAKLFLDRINAPIIEKFNSQQKFLFIRASGIPTLSGTLCQRKSKINCFFPDTLNNENLSKEKFFQEGDSVVILGSANLPDAYKNYFHSTITTLKGDHLEVLKENTLKNQVINFIFPSRFRFPD